MTAEGHARIGADADRAASADTPVLRLFPWLAFVLLALTKIALMVPQALGYSSEDEQLYLRMAADLASGRLYADPHYPPVHPVSLMPATWFDDPYRAGIALMAIYSSALVIPVWFIARELVGVRHAAVVATLSCLLPFHYTIPRTLLSENTYYPLLILAVYLAITTRWERLVARDALTGALIGVLVLVRYQTLAFIPGLALGWLLRERLRTGRWLPDREAVLRAVLLTACALAVFLPWPLAHMARGASASATIGADVQFGPGFDPAQLTLDRLATYFALYVGSWAIWLAPLLGLLGISVPLAWRDRLRAPLSRLTATSLLMTVALVTVVTRHSWRSRYNFPDPLRIMNRYGIYVVALGLLVGYATALAWPREKRLPAPVHWLLAFLGPAVLAAGGWYLVFRHGFIPPPHPAAVDTVSGGDTYRVLMMGAWFWPAALGSLAAIATLAWRRQRATAAVTVAAVALFLALGAPTYLSRLAEQPDFKLHALALADVATEHYPDLDLVSFAVSERVISESGLTTRRFLRGIRPNLDLAMGRAGKAGEITDPDYRWAHVYVFSAHEYVGPALSTYEIDGRSYVYVKQ